MADFSIILPTYNRYKSFKIALETMLLSLSGFTNWEIIIVDNSSTDGTIEFIHSKMLENKNIKLIVNEVPSAYVSRNLGIEHSEKEYIIFTEDDLVFPINWFEKINLLVLDNPDVRVFSTAIKSRGIYSKVISLIHTYEKNKIFETKRMNSGCFSASSLILVKKVFQEIGNFEVTNRGGDVEFTYRLLYHGENVYNASEIVVYHEFVDNFYVFVKRSMAYGYSISRINQLIESGHNSNETVLNKIWKNIMMPFLWIGNKEDKYLLLLLLSYIHEIAFITGSVMNKYFIKKNPVR